MKKINYKEGDIFTLPLRNGGFGVGLIARTSPHNNGVLLGYFSDKKFENKPTIEEANSLAIFPYIWRFGDLSLIDNTWINLGSYKHFENNKFTPPLFIRRDPLSKKAWEVRYSNQDITKIESEIPTDFNRHDLETDGLSGSGAVEIMLGKLLNL